MASKPLKISKDTADESESTKKKSFTFTVNYPLREPTFDKSVLMEIENEKSPLIEYMKKAVDEQNGLMEKFTVKYLLSRGYVIEAIFKNEREFYSKNESSWEIRTEPELTERGISNLIPEDGMKVLLELIQ
ncbi:uncharacterized protein LOC132743029 [Ruditapes philippinarum]|uniref:uncharacterized protein LOC132743029 n=1 Tax=Ruditapes philippinarum TaxID=129788 RepID=UPI00295A9C9A|nr:uncharacterized protein LOC132743029 [Ruditapes philippinarum]